MSTWAVVARRRSKPGRTTLWSWLCRYEQTELEPSGQAEPAQPRLAQPRMVQPVQPQAPPARRPRQQTLFGGHNELLDQHAEKLLERVNDPQKRQVVENMIGQNWAGGIGKALKKHGLNPGNVEDAIGNIIGDLYDPKRPNPFNTYEESLAHGFDQHWRRHVGNAAWRQKHLLEDPGFTEKSGQVLEHKGKETPVVATATKEQTPQTVPLPEATPDLSQYTDEEYRKLLDMGRVLKVLERKPNATVAQISRTLSSRKRGLLSAADIRAHMTSLKEMGKIDIDPSPTHADVAERKKARSRSPEHRKQRVLNYLTRNPTATIRELSKNLSTSRERGHPVMNVGEIRQHIASLNKEGLLNYTEAPLQKTKGLPRDELVQNILGKNPNTLFAKLKQYTRTTSEELARILQELESKGLANPEHHLALNSPIMKKLAPKPERHARLWSEVVRYAETPDPLPSREWWEEGGFDEAEWQRYPDGRFRHRKTNRILHPDEGHDGDDESQDETPEQHCRTWAAVTRYMESESSLAAGQGRGQPVPELTPKAPAIKAPVPAPVNLDAAAAASKAEQKLHGITIARWPNQVGVAPFHEHSQALFPHLETHPSEVAIAKLAGALRGSRAHIIPANEGLEVHVAQPGVKEQSRSIGFNHQTSRPFMYIDHTETQPQGTGLGTLLFVRQVREAQKLGLDAIRNLSAKSSGESRIRGGSDRVPLIGYKVWPKFGYDAPLKPRQLAELPRDLQGARTVQDLMNTPGGEKWWRDHGDSFQGKFDLKPGSVSLRKLESYLAGQGLPPISDPHWDQVNRLESLGWQPQKRRYCRTWREVVRYALISRGELVGAGAETIPGAGVSLVGRTPKVGLPSVGLDVPDVEPPPTLTARRPQPPTTAPQPRGKKIAPQSAETPATEPAPKPPAPPASPPEPAPTVALPHVFKVGPLTVHMPPLAPQLEHLPEKDRATAHALAGESRLTYHALAGTKLLSGTGKGDRPRVRDIGEFLATDVRRSNGRTLDPAIPRDFNRMVDQAAADIKYQLSQPNSGERWYTDAVNEAFQLTSLLPKLKDLATTPPLRVLATAVAGIMGNLPSPKPNWRYTIIALEHWMEHGEFPAHNPDSGVGWPTRNATQTAVQLRLLDKLLEQKGLAETAKFLTTLHPPFDLAEWVSEQADEVNGKKVPLYKGFPDFGTQPVFGMRVIGRKLGPYALAMSGLGPSPIDKWMTRAWLMGLGSPHILDPTSKETGLRDRPRSEAENDLIQEWVRQAGLKTGHNVRTAQAIKWAHVQQLFNTMGVPTETETLADGAKQVLAERGIVPGRIPRFKHVSRARKMVATTVGGRRESQTRLWSARCGGPDRRPAQAAPGRTWALLCRYAGLGGSASGSVPVPLDSAAVATPRGGGFPKAAPVAPGSGRVIPAPSAPAIPGPVSPVATPVPTHNDPLPPQEALKHALWLRGPRSANRVSLGHVPGHGRVFLKEYNADADHPGNPHEAYVEHAVATMLRELGHTDIPRSDLRNADFSAHVPGAWLGTEPQHLSRAVEGTNLAKVMDPRLNPELYANLQERMFARNPADKMADWLTSTWLFNATDRHAKNYKVADDGTLHPLDFGLSLVPFPGHEPAWDYNQEALVREGLVSPDQPLNRATLLRLRERMPQIIMRAKELLPARMGEYRSRALRVLRGKMVDLEHLLRLRTPRLRDLPRDETPRLAYHEAEVDH